MYQPHLVSRYRIAINLPGSPIQFDPFPFSFLTMIVSLEAIGLSIFVLISENSQAHRADRLARLRDAGQRHC